MTYADIILPLPLEGYFTYCVPDTLAPRLQPGCRVRVPLGKTKTYTGLVAALHDQVPAGLKTGKEGVKSIVEMMDPGPVLLPQQLRLWQWIADYYLSPIGDVYKAALPSGLKAEDDYRPKTETYVVLADDFRSAQALRAAQAMLQRAPAQQKVLRAYLELASVSEENPVPQREITREELMNEAHCTATVLRQFLDRRILRQYEKEVGRIPLGGMPHPEHIKPLSEAQADAYNQILVQQMSKDITLLHGVTSSGKTEIYIHLIQRALDEGRQVLYLLPEIALTVQMMQRLRRVFGDRLGIYHSRYSDAERVEIWKRQLSDHPYDVILGARSALFLPFQRLGLVIVDEEHEQSFKQMDPAPRYHARSAAIILAKLCGAKVLLGTATPSSESYWNAQTGKYGYVRLDKRYQDMALPAVEVVDVKDLRRRKMMTGHFSPRLLAAIRAALASGKQAILFQNRRGFAPRVECHVCGWTPKCPHCDVSLTYHKTMGLLTCHYCGYVLRVPTVCPNCESHDIRGRGFGTERVEDELQALVPEAKIARMDLDTTRTKNAYERIINSFAQGKTNVLVGTQMVTKGLDFDHVGVVGILYADAMLNIPDFRAYEQAFAMLSQVSGRAGRKGDQQGLVILQTSQPNSPVIQQVVRHDYRAFYDQLFEERRLFRYPPFTHLTYIYLKHRQERTVESASMEMGSRLRQIFGDRVLGPDKPSVARVKTLHIRKLMLKLELGIDLRRVRQCLREVQSAMLRAKTYGALQIYYDVDPL